ncbi:MAG: stage III sporulation protein AE [Lachnospiraceae bacterium]|nr:stage III sporulation protein AE [Lachnospiraceae bacterium]
MIMDKITKIKIGFFVLMCCMCFAPETIAGSAAYEQEAFSVVGTEKEILYGYADASDENETENDYADELEQFDFGELDSVIGENDNAENTAFSSIVKLLIQGRFKEVLSRMGDTIKDTFAGEVNVNKNIIWQVIVIAAVSAIFTNFAEAFDSGQVGETGFFISYLMMSTLLITSFMTVSALVEDTIRLMLKFVMALIPSFYFAVMFTGKELSSVAFYELTVAASGVTEWLFLKLLLPFSKVYIAFIIANNITKESLLDKFSELMIKAIQWCSKSLFGIVIGVSVIQNLILPYADAVKTSAITKTLSALPGVGGAVDSASGLVFATANLIKNGIGTAALVVIASMCLLPVVKISAIYLIMLFTAAVVEPVSDKRIAEMISRFAAGIKAMLMMIFYSAALFMIIIAMVCAATVPDT